MYPPPNFRSSTGNIFADFGLPDELWPEVGDGVKG